MIKRSPLNRRGKQSLRESKVSPEHEQMLMIFWARAKQFTHDGQPHRILKILQDCAAVDGRKVASRYAFDRMKHRFKSGGYYCIVCNDEATVRHHILPISGGGPNAAVNVCALCSSCHAKIHPWLETNSSCVPE